MIPNQVVKARKTEAGFSLVELAIVLIIIGLIVGGVLKGQDLIESARVNSVQTQLNEVRVAASTFLTKYDSMPGDLVQTDLVATGLSAGNGNGRVGAAGGSRIGVAPNAASAAGEAVNFWQHLRAAGLVGGVQAVTGGTNMALSDTLQSRVGGGYTVNYETLNANTAHWVLLGTDRATPGTVNDAAVLTPIQARSIDVKADDGNPSAGNVQAITGNGSAANSCVNSGAYATGSTVTCAAYFKL